MEGNWNRSAGESDMQSPNSLLHYFNMNDYHNSCSSNANNYCKLYTNNVVRQCIASFLLVVFSECLNDDWCYYLS